MARLWTRAIRPPPPSDITPNPNDPASVPPSTVGPDQLVTPGDPHGVTVDDIENPGWSPPRIIPSAWSGWPADWWPPNWSSTGSDPLVDTAWMCIDLNSSLLSTMPPYLVNAADTLSADWLRNPEPDLYFAWEEFAKQLFWDWHLGEAFVLVTARYSTGWPARFHVVPPWTVNVEMDGGRRYYSIGSEDVTADVLHLRYQSNVADSHGHGPLEAAATRITAAKMLIQYAFKLTAGGGIPSGILTHPDELSDEQAASLQAQWVEARLSTLGEPAVLSGGISWEATQVDPEKMALQDLAQTTESRIAQMLGVPPELVGLPSGRQSMTYATVNGWFDFHWRAGLRPKAVAVMSGLSEWLIPRGTRIEVNADAYVQPAPLERAQTYQILNSIKDEMGNPAMTVQQIQQAERLTNATPDDVASGVLK